MRRYQMIAGTKVFTFLAISLFLMPSAHTQTVTENNNTGYPQNAIVQGTEIESVQISNGNLHIEIPIYTSKGRGLDVAYNFVLDTKGWGFTTQCIQGVCTDHPNPDTHSHIALTASGPFNTYLNYKGSGLYCSGVYMYDLKSNVVFTEPNGTKHHFLPDPVRSKPTLAACDGSGSTYAQTLYAGDGSGWVASIDSNFQLQNAIRKDGAASGTEDSNGNVLTVNGTGGTDTLGRTANGDGSYMDTTGTQRSVTVVNTSVPVVLLPLCTFSQADDCTVNRTSITAPSSITLPNGMTYSFTYAQDGGGEPLTMTLPTGGQVSWTWGAWDSGGRRVASRTVTANGVSGTWNYSYVGAVTVTDPASNDTRYTCTNIVEGNGNALCYVSKVEYFSGLASGNQVIKTVATDYQIYPWPNFFNVAVPSRETTTWNLTNQVRKTETDFDTFAATGGTATWQNPIETREYDWGIGAAGSLVRRTHFNYLHLQNSTYRTKNIANRRTSRIVYDGSGSTVAQTTYTYDGTAVQSTSATPAPGHDYTNYSSSNNIRGNLTQLSNWVNTSNSWLNTNNTYDDLGNLLSTTDPLNHTTSFDFTDNFTDGVNRNTRAYVTTSTHPTTNGIPHVERKQYFFNIGPVAASCGQNFPAASVCTNAASIPQPDYTRFTYDLMNRPLVTTRGDGGQTSYSYNDTVLPVSISSTQTISTGVNLANTVLLDGMGRVKQTQLTSDPQGAVYTDATYDKLGRIATVSNPYRGGTDITTTAGITTYYYEVLGRKCLEVPPDGTQPTGGICPSTQPANTIFTTYSGNATTATDQTGRSRKSISDGLDRIAQVFEDPVGLNWETDYRYDVLDNLVCAAQKGTNTGTFSNCAATPASWRPRTFTYDSLSRLLTSNNPEVGTITYKYDSDANCVSPNSFPSLLVSKTDARGIRTCSQFDALNRETVRNYSNGDSTVATSYDQSACLGLSVCHNIGQRTGMTDAAGSEGWSVDLVNRMRKDQRTTEGVTKTATYLLDLAGNTTQITYPNGRVVTYTFDSANRTSTASDSTNGITVTGFKTTPGSTCLANVTCYTPQGTFYAVSIGQTATFNGLNLTHIYNSRLQPQQFKASSTGGNAIDITYSYADPLHSNRNAGHVFSITNNLDTTRSQNFAYDQLNRITGATTASTFSTSPSHCWGEAYGVDAWGSLQSISPTTVSGYTGCTQEAGFSQTAGTNNRLSGSSYDASGNTLGDGVNSYTWNAESQLKTAAGVTYHYDGDGRRVSKVGSKLYWYGAGGEILAETDTSGTTTAAFIYFGGKRIATVPASGSPTYYIEDMLGTSRVLTTNAGVVCYDADFYPYGGERSYTNTCPQNYKFEGKERDTETGNDDFGARYYSNRFGRWLSADWSATPVAVPYANLANPQTLNLYSMVADDPESFADLDGHCCDDNTIDFALGVLRGIASSATFGAVGAPKATDSLSSLAGQLSGTGIAGAGGEVIKDVGLGGVGVGLGAELPSAGTSTAVVAVGAVGVVAGQAIEVGSVANLARVAGVILAKNAQTGGGRNEQKSNPDRQQSAKDKLETTKAERDNLKSKPNKTPEDKAKLEKLNDQVKHLQKKAAEKSETHSRKEKGNAQ